MSDAERFVRDRYPQAHILGPMKNGKRHPDGGYGVLLRPFWSFTSGCGKTIIEAWADAANRLQAKEQAVQEQK